MIFYHHLYIFPISQKSPEIATKQRTQLFLTVFFVLYLVLFLKLSCCSRLKPKKVHWTFLVLFLIIAKVG